MTSLLQNPGARNTKTVSIVPILKDSLNELIVPVKTNRMNLLKWKWCVRIVACVNRMAVLMKLKKVKKIQMAIPVAGLANMLKAPKKARMADKFVTVCPTKAFKSPNNVANSVA